MNPKMHDRHDHHDPEGHDHSHLPTPDADVATFDDAELLALLRAKAPKMAYAIRENGMDRRTFLKLMGASLALMGLSAAGCAPVRPGDGKKLIPYVKQPEEVIPGKPNYFASVMTLGGFATGVLIETHEGRPTRIEGNPRHPSSLGGSDVFTQASILDLYNPERSTQVRKKGNVSSWDEFMAAFEAELARLRPLQGTGLRILTETVTSPTLASQIAALLQAFPNAKWHQYEPVNQDNVLLGARAAFGQAVNTVYRFDRAKVVVSLDADFMGSMPGCLRYARDFMAARKVRTAGKTGQELTMSRLYAVESSPTVSGLAADHRLKLRPSQVKSFARALAAALGVSGVTAPASTPWNAAWFEAVVADLKANEGSSIVVVGPNQPPAVHALAHAINAQLKNAGSTVIYTEPVIANPVVQAEDLAALAQDISANQVQTLIILGGNPAFTAPANLDFANAISRVGFSVHLSLYNDETSKVASWHLPAAHFVEAWSDARAHDGSLSIVQPPIQPLYPVTRSAHELLAMMVGDSRPAYEIVKAVWQQKLPAGDFEQVWRRALHDGVLPDSALPAIQPALSADFGAQITALLGQEPTATGLEIAFRPDPTLWDGRFADNSWLQELPEPITNLSWDNAALVSPATASRLNVGNEDLVDLSYRGKILTLPVWVVASQPDDVVTVSLGYGRGLSPELEANLNFNAYALRQSDAPWFDGGLEVRAKGQRYTLAAVRAGKVPEGIEAVPVATLAEFAANPNVIREKQKKIDASLLPPFAYNDNAWGMTIDVSACIGCNACVLGCQTENNIPTVGKKAVSNSREMYWLRVDRYEDASDETRSSFQPVPCQHCETAPCEQVCPVQATVHSTEGLNQMIYNRCVGTRYCSANCPYSVRRFNYAKYATDIPLLQEMLNPDVTVRAEGVMEKCTYCVQRINAARIEAAKANRPIADGEIVPACAAACPTQAIVFGNLNDPNAVVTQEKAEPHNYGLLAELNTKPRTTYLARVYNPNETLHKAQG